MRILTYKRTHTGDPDESGMFGVNDCMGQVRDLEFDAAIGIGGTSAEPRAYQIDGKLTWVGIGAHKKRGPWPSSVVTFDIFVLVDSGGPALVSIGPRLARRMYEGKVRYMTSGYSPEERTDAEAILDWARTMSNGVSGSVVKTVGKCRVRCVCKPKRK
jgi:hypothetical protein